MATPDINMLNLQDEIVEVGAGASAEDFFAVPLPDDGEHRANLYLGNRGITIERQKDKTTGQRTGPAFVSVHVQAKIVDPETGAETLSTFDQLTSVMMQSGMSRLHAAMALAGVTIPNRCTIPELKTIVETAFAQPLSVGIVTQWQAEEKIGDKYETVLKGQKKFPPQTDAEGAPIPGKYNAEVVNPKSGTPVRAQAKIVRYARAK